MQICGIIILGDNMIIKAVVEREAVRNHQMIEEYERLIVQLPKGTLILRKNEYYYLKYRKDGRVHDEYIGKDPQKIVDIKDKLEQRRHCKDMLASLKQEQKAIHQILEGLK